MLGSTEPVSYTYDALYRMKTLKDAALNTTSYFYNGAGYLAQVIYPGAQATPPTVMLAAGTKDTVSFPAYDSDGNRLSRTDGNNVTTTYAYDDDDGLTTKNVTWTTLDQAGIRQAISIATNKLNVSDAFLSTTSVTA